MNVKTFMLLITVSLTAACSQTPVSVTTTDVIETEAVNDKTHLEMSNVNTDVDMAFMQGMIPHHVDAVNMAKIVLERGKDPEVRALAERVIAAQESEIKEMQRWIALHNFANDAPIILMH